MHHQHSHHKETWTRGKRLPHLIKRHLWLNLPPPQLLRCSWLHCRLSRYLRHHQLSHWDQGAHTPSSTLTIPTPEQQPPSYTRRRSPLSRQSSMGSRTTWPSSWRVCAIELGGSTGTDSSPCRSRMAPRRTCSPTTGRFLWTTQGHTRLPT